MCERKLYSFLYYMTSLYYVHIGWLDALRLIMTGAGVVVANVVALTVHRLLESFPQLVGFFATVFSATRAG